MSKHFDVTVTTVESFSIWANSEEEAVDLAQEKFSSEQATLIDVFYEAEECLSADEESQLDERRANEKS